jgi:hypothetical protein
MIWSQELTNTIASHDPSRTEALKSLGTTLLCEGVGGLVGKIPKIGGYFSTATSSACGGAATYVDGDEVTLEDTAINLGQGATCQIVDEFTSRSVFGPLCSVTAWIGTSWLEWMKQSEIIDAGVMGGCYAIPVNQYTHEPEYGWHQQAGFPLIPGDPWCYSETGPYMGDWD